MIHLNQKYKKYIRTYLKNVKHEKTIEFNRINVEIEKQKRKH